MTRGAALVSLGLLGAAAVAVLAVALAGGGLGRGELNLHDPCERRAAFRGDGFDAKIQGVVLAGLDRAACELGTSRERLLLSLDPATRSGTRWSGEEAEAAIRDGLVAAIDEAEDQDRLSGFEATVMRSVARRAPLELLVQGVGALGSLIP